MGPLVDGVPLKEGRKMLRTISITLLTLSMAGCGGGRHRDAASPEPRAMKATEWSARDAAAPLWPATAKRVQLIVTSAWSAGDHFVWVIGDGTKPIAVYHAGPKEIADVMSRLGELVKAEVESPLLAISHGGQGIVIGPPPPPPDGPLGIPPYVVRAVVDYAGQLDRTSRQLDRELLGAH
jgi:hypothetical protein